MLFRSEGELKGAEQVARDLIRAAVGSVFTGMFTDVDTRSVVEWFDLGGTLPLSDTSSAEDVVRETKGVQGMREIAKHAGLPGGAATPHVASAIDFVLEGLCAQRKISRSDDRGYMAGTESTPKSRGRREEPTLDDDFRMPGGKKKYYN